MTELERAAREYEKCKNDPYYFFRTYCTVTTKKDMTKREKLEGIDFEEISDIYFKYFTKVNKRDIHVRMIEKVTNEDGEMGYVLTFNNGLKSMIDWEQVLPLLRKEKLEKLCLHR